MLLYALYRLQLAHTVGVHSPT